MDVIYEAPVFHLAPVERVFLRVWTLALFIVGGLAILMLLFSGGRLTWIGVLFFAFYLDRLLRFMKGHKTIRKDMPQIIAKSGRPLNVEGYFTPRARSFLLKSFHEAEIRNNDAVEFYLMINFLSDRLVRRALRRIGTDEDGLMKAIMSLEPKKDFNRATKQALLEKLNRIAGAAFDAAYRSSRRAVDYYFLILPLFDSNLPGLKKTLSDFNIAKEDMLTALNFEILKNQITKDHAQPLAGLAGRRLKRRLANRAWTSRPTPFLDRHSEDLTDLARGGSLGFLIGHGDELDRLLNVVARQTRNNALLVGEPGVGKTSVAWNLAKRIVDDEVPEALFDKRLVQLDIGSIVSGAETAKVQENVTRIVEEILKAKNIILYIPDFHSLKQTSAPGQLSAFDILKPYFRASTFQIIGDTDPLNYEKYLTVDPDFLETFETVRIEEISEEDATVLLSMEGLILERRYRITIQAPAIKKAVELAKRYLRPKVLPTSARDVLAEALEEARRTKQEILTADFIVDLVSRMVRVPLEQATGAEAQKLLDLENQLHKRLIDQDEAVSVVAQALRQFRAGLGKKKGPIASFLFVGPTGVGKTELSKALAEIYFGSEDKMIRLDMSEYQLKESLERFLGTREGVSGTFAQSVKDQPYSLILLDEFEKANPDILNIFLAIFDDGRMTDALGRTVDFSNAILIATSNAHSNLIKDELDKSTEFSQIVDLIKKKLADYFKPELLNRFDAVVIFKPLGEKEIHEITKLQLASLVKDLEKTQGIFASFEDSAVQQLVKEGLDPVFGARPLKRVISARIRDALANMILKGELSRGSRVQFRFENGAFVVKKS